MKQDNDESEFDDIGEEEEEMDSCSGFFDGGVFVCMAVGSEQCEWDCPFSNDIGKTARAIYQRDRRELEKAIRSSL